MWRSSQSDPAFDWAPQRNLLSQQRRFLYYRAHSTSVLGCRCYTEQCTSGGIGDSGWHSGVRPAPGWQGSKLPRPFYHCAIFPYPIYLAARHPDCPNSSACTSPPNEALHSRPDCSIRRVTKFEITIRARMPASARAKSETPPTGFAGGLCRGTSGTEAHAAPPLRMAPFAARRKSCLGWTFPSSPGSNIRSGVASADAFRGTPPQPCADQSRAAASSMRS